MKKTIATTLLLLCVLSVGAQKKVAVSSPDGKLRFTLTVTDAGIVYDVTYKKKPVVNASPLGFEFDSGEFGAGVSVGRLRSRTIDETYELVIGKVAVARNHCRETVIPLVEKSAPGRRIDLAVRVFDDGVAFRYEFPEQQGWDSYIMYDERSGFRMAGDPLTLYMNLPGYINTHENVYNRDSYGTIAEGRLPETWAEVAGPMVASCTDGVEFRTGILTVRIASSVVRHETFLRRSALRDEINRRAGAMLVRELIVK